MFRSSTQFLVSLLLLWLSPLSAQTTWPGCVLDSSSSEVTIGETTTVCLVLSDANSWNRTAVNYLRLALQPKADEYSRFVVPSSHADLVTADFFGSESISVHAASGRGLSFQKFYFSNETVYNSFTAVISVKKGIVDGISWDDGCIFCSTAECDATEYDFGGGERNIGGGSCGVKNAECTDGNCDLTLYVVWTGTDKNGVPFQSSAYRFSAFPKQDWADFVPSIF